MIISFSLIQFIICIVYCMLHYYSVCNENKSGSLKTKLPNSTTMFVTTDATLQFPSFHLVVQHLFIGCSAILLCGASFISLKIFICINHNSPRYVREKLSKTSNQITGSWCILILHALSIAVLPALKSDRICTQHFD